MAIVYRLAVGLETLACSQPSPCARCSNQDEALSLDEGRSSCAHGRQIQQQATHLRQTSGQLAASNHHTTPVRSSTYYRKPTTLALLTAAVAQLVTPGLSGSECGHRMGASGLAFLLGHDPRPLDLKSVLGCAPTGILPDPYHTKLVELTCAPWHRAAVRSRHSLQIYKVRRWASEWRCRQRFCK